MPIWFMHEKATHYVVLRKVHVAVKEMINLSDEMDPIITQKYKKNPEMP